MKIKCFCALVMFTVLINFHANENFQKAIELRQEGEYKQAERLLKDYSSPVNFESLGSTEKVEFLKGLLELAHNRAMLDDVTGALSLLNWAESQKNSYHRAIACTKYAQILIDMGEFERASAYLKNATEAIGNQARENANTMAIGQGGSVVDNGAVWRDLKEDIAVLQAEIEAEELQKKFGATYGNYVKLRRLQVLLKRARTPRYLKQALILADEIVETDPASQFAAAAQYLKGSILASRLSENSPKKEIKDVKDYLEKFVRQQPDGLYRGEALMLLGKISLEIEWDAKDAEKFYSQALEYFQKSRERRDAVSLYASINDDLKDQSKPTQRPTTLNQWKRIVYHDEDPLKLYNTANAPTWYIDDNEKNCVYILGFLAFANEKYDKAKQYWSKILSLSPDIAALDQRLPNVQTRLLQACRLKAMAFWKEEKSSIKSDKARIQLLQNEYLILIEQFEDALKGFQEIAKTDDLEVKAVAYIGIIVSTDLIAKNDSKVVAEKYCYWILEQKELKKEPIYARALLIAGQLKTSRNGLEKLAIPFFQRYVKEFPKGRDIRVAKYSLAKCYLKTKQLSKAKSIYNDLSKTQDIYSENLLKRINNHQNGGTK